MHLASRSCTTRVSSNTLTHRSKRLFPLTFVPVGRCERHIETVSTRPSCTGRNCYWGQITRDLENLRPFQLLKSKPVSTITLLQSDFVSIGSGSSPRGGLLSTDTVWSERPRPPERLPLKFLARPPSLSFGTGPQSLVISSQGLSRSSLSTVNCSLAQLSSTTAAASVPTSGVCAN